MTSKWEIEKFSKDNDFGLWKVMMQIILIQKKCIATLKGERLMLSRLTQTEKAKMMDRARSFIILFLRDKVLREKTTTLMWAKIEPLYMT